MALVSNFNGALRLTGFAGITGVAIMWSWAFACSSSGTSTPSARAEAAQKQKTDYFLGAGEIPGAGELLAAVRRSVAIKVLHFT